MRVWVVDTIVEHDEHDPIADTMEVLGVFQNKADAIAYVVKQFEDERLGRGLDEDDGWTDNNGGNIRDEEDKCEISWVIEPYEVW